MAQNFIPLFTNKIIGLKRVERNRTTFVNLVDYSWERANEGDNLSEQTLPEDENNDDNTNSSDSSESDGPPNQDSRDQDDSHHDRENHHSQSEETNKSKLNESVSSKRKREDNYPSSNQNKRPQTFRHCNQLHESPRNGVRKKQQDNSFKQSRIKSKIYKGKVRKTIQSTVAEMTKKTGDQESVHLENQKTKHSLVSHLTKRKSPTA